MRSSLHRIGTGAASAARRAALVSAPARTFAFKQETSPLLPFHLAVPTHDLKASREFYGGLLRCEEGRSAATWIDWNLYGHQLVTHFAGAKYRGVDYFNDVDRDMVPVPHFGVCLGVAQFKALAAHLTSHGVKFIVEPHLRFSGKPGEQWTMFLKDPSNNSLEFKALTNPANLFAKYYVE